MIYVNEYVMINIPDWNNRGTTIYSRRISTKFGLIPSLSEHFLLFTWFNLLWNSRKLGSHKYLIESLQAFIVNSYVF